MSSMLSIRLLGGRFDGRRGFDDCFLTLVAGIATVLMLRFLRQRFLPFEGPEASSLFTWSAIALLVSFAIGGTMASSFQELLRCPYAWNLPKLPHRAARELRLAGGFLFGAAAGLGFLLAAGTGTSGWFLPLLTASAFALTVFYNDPPVAASRVLAVIPLAGACFCFFSPEIAAATGHLPWLWAAGAAALMLGAVNVTATAAARRNRAAPRGAANRWFEVDRFHLLYGGASEGLQNRRAPREGADSFRGVRRSDVDWMRALLHEMSGFQRGGWIGAAFLLVVTTSIAAAGVFFLFESVFPPLASRAGAVGYREDAE